MKIYNLARKSEVKPARKDLKWLLHHVNTRINIIKLYKCYVFMKIA